jgi:hypothetical protein
MSKKKNPHALFPELNNLRRTLLDMQDTFAGSKPKLNEALATLMPRERSKVIDKISATAATPLGKVVPTQVSAQMRAFRSAIRGIDNSLRDDSTKRSGLFQGELDGDIIKAFEQPLIDSKNEILRLSTELGAAAFGAKAIDMQHELDTHVQLLNVGLNAFLETLDLRQYAFEPGSSLDDSVTSIGNKIGELAEVAAARSTWALISAWISRWAERPSYRDKVAAWLPFAAIQLAPVQNVDRYKIGDVIASATTHNGKIARATLVAGRLPAGLEFSVAEGAIVVADPKRLIAGRYSGISFQVENERGFVNALTIPSLELGYDEEATYTLIPNLFIDTIEENALLAYPTDPDGKMVGAQVISGRMPAGTQFDSISGEIRVANKLRLRPGTYPLTIMTYDEIGGESTHEIELAIMAPAAISSATVHADNPIQLPVPAGEVIAYVSVANGYIVGTAVVSGAMPPGVRHNSAANFIVANPTVLVAGVYAFNLSLTTSMGEVINLPVQLHLVGNSRVTTGGNTVPTDILTPRDTVPTDLLTPREPPVVVDTRRPTDITTPIDTRVPTEITTPIDTRVPTEITTPIDTRVPTEITKAPGPKETTVPTEILKPKDLPTVTDTKLPKDILQPIDPKETIGTKDALPPREIPPVTDTKLPREIFKPIIDPKETLPLREIPPVTDTKLPKEILKPIDPKETLPPREIPPVTDTKLPKEILKPTDLQAPKDIVNPKNILPPQDGKIDPKK